MKPFVSTWWSSFINKIYILLKPPESNESKNIEVTPQIEKVVANKVQNNATKKAEFVQLIMDLESGKITETDLQLHQLEMLIKYYDMENNQLEKHIKDQENLVKNLNLKLNKKYEKAIKMKMNSL